MSKFVHIFPLSIYRDSLTLAPDYKQQLIDSILQMEAASQKKSVDRAWLGDTAGHEFLFQREEFQELFRAIAQKIRDYTMALGMNNDLLDFYFQRSWATVTRRGEYARREPPAPAPAQQRRIAPSPAPASSW